MHKTFSLITVAFFALIWTKSPAAQSFISDPFGVKIDGSYYFSQKSGDSVKLMVSDLSSEGTQPAPFTFKSIGSMVRLGDRLILRRAGQGIRTVWLLSAWPRKESSIDQGPCGKWLVIPSGIDGFGRSSVLLCE